MMRMTIEQIARSLQASLDRASGLDEWNGFGEGYATLRAEIETLVKTITDKGPYQEHRDAVERAIKYDCDFYDTDEPHGICATCGYAWTDRKTFPLLCCKRL